jgi:hypothetical protein
MVGMDEVQMENGVMREFISIDMKSSVPMEIAFKIVEM